MASGHRSATRRPRASALDGALQVAALGVRVVPVWGVASPDGANGARTCACPDGAGCTSPGKHPIEKRWQSLATTTERTIRHWAKLYGDCNFGALGDDVIVVDVDPKNGGTLEGARTHCVPTNWVVATGGGGWHLGFLPGEGRTANARLGEGIDLKATGGYVVCPGSAHVSGTDYTWIARPRARDAMVAWVGVGADPATGDQTERSQLATLLGHPAEVGNRNIWLTQVAGHYAKAFKYQDAYEWHVAQAGASLVPPLMPDEIRKVTDSIWQREATSEPSTGDGTWQPYDLATFAEHPPPEPDRFGPGRMLYRGEVHWVAGEPESGKSILAYAACVEEMQHDHTVMILDEDAGVRDAGTKLLALGATAPMLRERMAYLPPAGRNLFKDWDRLTELVVAYQPTIVVVDAAADHLEAADRDEDKARDVTGFIRRVLKPLAHTHGCAVVVIDHKTKSDPGSRYGRGSGSKLAKSEVGYNVTAPEVFHRHQSGRLHVVCTKDKPGYIGRDTSWMVRVLVQHQGGTITLVPGQPLSPSETRAALRLQQGAKPAAQPPEDDENATTAPLVLATLDGSMVPMTPSEMKIARDRTTISRVLHALERKGWVRSERGQANRKLWSLTDEGRARLDRGEYPSEDDLK